MDEGFRSGGVVKKKSSSGCLIIKKKGDGLGGAGSTGSHKEKKRPRLILSDSGSSDELLEPYRRKVADKFRNAPVEFRKNVVKRRDFGGNGEFGSEERKRSRLDLFDFDEYDEFDEKNIMNECMAGVHGNMMEFGSGSSRRRNYFDGTNIMVGGKNKRVDYAEGRFETDDDEAHLPISYLKEKFREASDEPIRLQGKNGVLKVMVNQKKKMGLSHNRYDRWEVEDRKDSRSEDAVRKNALTRPSFYSDSKRPEKPVPLVKTEKSEPKLRKTLPTKSSKGGDLETDNNHASLKLEPPNMETCDSAKRVKSEGKITPSTENVKTVRTKEGKNTRGSGTEKQVLREQIRNMLVKAGWTIDYRPRRNRDYLDAVYTNPTGTAYWSIIKAYDALQKQLEEEGDNTEAGENSSAFLPLSNELLNKLTRQTRKKMEKEMKKKRRDDRRSKNAREGALKEPTEGMESQDSDQHEETVSFYMKRNGKSMKGRLHESDNVTGDDSMQRGKGRIMGRCTLLVRSSDNRQNSESDGYVPYTGKRTLLGWLIDSTMVQLSEKVQYMNRRQTKVMQEGWVTRDGIHCGCCSKIVTISKFELHAGVLKPRHPYQHIVLESGRSLLQCLLDAWNRQEGSECRGFNTVHNDGDDPDDDTCGICGDGGDLICCDGCPSTFHQSCLDIKMLPLGDWHCPNCTCKFCMLVGGSETEESRSVEPLLTCSLCEKKYHESCSQKMDALPADSVTISTDFCGKKCQELFNHLQNLLGVKHELEAGLSWSLIHRTDLDLDATHRGFPQRVECNSKLAVALAVMDECFLPIFDRRSGINLIHNVLYNCGSNFSRLDYSGFYTAILERGDEIIAAASIRIHGTELAEMPFIGTRHIYRRQGMCRRLLGAIESALGSLKVEKLIIPAIAEHMHTWTVGFGFNPLEELHKQEMKSMNMLVFPGTDMLQKQIVKVEITDGNVVANSGGSSAENIAEEANRDQKNPVSISTACATDERTIQFTSDFDHQRAVETERKLHVASEVGSDTEVTNVEGNIQSSVEGSKCDAGQVNAKDACVEISPESTTEKVQKQNSDPVSTPTSTGECAVHLNPDSNQPNVLDMEHGLHESLKPFSDVEVDSNSKAAPIQSNIPSSAVRDASDDHQGRVEVNCVEPALSSLGDISSRNNTEEIEEIKANQNPVSTNTFCCADEGMMTSEPDLSHQCTAEVENVLPLDSEICSEAKVDPAESYVQSSAVGDRNDTHEINIKGNDERVHDFSQIIYVKNTAEEINENKNPASVYASRADENVNQQAAVDRATNGNNLKESSSGSDKTTLQF